MGIITRMAFSAAENAVKHVAVNVAVNAAEKALASAPGQRLIEKGVGAAADAVSSKLAQKLGVLSGLSQRRPTSPLSGPSKQMRVAISNVVAAHLKEAFARPPGTRTRYGAAGAAKPVDDPGPSAESTRQSWRTTLGMEGKSGIAELKAKADNAASKAETREVLKAFVPLRREVELKAGVRLARQRDDANAAEQTKAARRAAFAEIDAAVAAIEAGIAHKSGADPYVAPKDTRGQNVRAKASDEAAFQRLGVDPQRLANAANPIQRALRLLRHPDPDVDIRTLNGAERAALVNDVRKLQRNAARAFHPDRNPNDAVADKAMSLINEAYSEFVATVESFP